MKSIMVTYPGFQGLPKGIKQLLLASESHFFEEAKSAPLPSTFSHPDYWAPSAARKPAAVHTLSPASPLHPQHATDDILNGIYFYQPMRNTTPTATPLVRHTENIFPTTGTNHN